MRDHDHQLQRPDPALTDDENIIRREVEKAIHPYFMTVTYNLQMDLDEATEARQHEATLAAYAKKLAIRAATSATQTAIDEQQALQGHPSLANNMEHLMEEKISRLMDTQLNDRIPKHVTKVMKSWGQKTLRAAGNNHQPSPMATHPMVPDQKSNILRQNKPNGKSKRRVQSHRRKPKTLENATTSAATSLQRNRNRIRRTLTAPREETETTLPAESAKGTTTGKEEIGRSRSRNARPSDNPTN